MLSRELLWRVGRWWLAAVSGALLAVWLFLLFYRIGGLTSVAPPIALSGASWRLAQGQGEATAAGLVIRQAGSQGWALVQGSARIAPAAVYRQIAWQIADLPPDRELRLVWNTLDDPARSYSRTLGRGLNHGMLDLGAEPRWRGRILALGLLVPGPLTEPVRIERLELRPVTPAFGALAQELAADWRAFEPWSQRSINFAADAPLNALFPPVPMVLLALALSAACYALLEPPRRRPGVLWPYVGLLLLGWLALDLRWQWTLTERLRQTAADFAGKSAEQRWLAMDQALYPFLQEVRKHLPQLPQSVSRLFIISADPTGFATGRARYHLLPHNSYVGFTALPLSGMARPGDYLLLLAPLADLRYDSAQGRLEGQGVRLSADLRYVAESGGLFQVRD